MIRKNIYKWHRKISIIIAWPVLMWAISGLIHPIMTNIRPRIATQQSPETIIDSSMLKYPLDKALRENGIDVFYNFRIVAIDNILYYQVQKNEAAMPVYLCALDGKQLINGDELYGLYLANHFASDKKLQVKSVGYVTDYTNDYNHINRYLPVYCVQLKRDDGICIYVDTRQSRFAYATNSTRSFLTRAFTLLHTWSWMGSLTLIKVIIISLLMLLTLVNGVVGLYIFFATKQKNTNGYQTLKRRRNHRYTAVFASLFTLLFAFSGAVHVLAELRKDDRGKVISSQNIYQNESGFDIGKVLQLIAKPIGDMSFVRMDSRLYLRVVTLNESSNIGKDLMEQMHVEKPNVFFIDLSNYILLQNGEELYANYLANTYLHRIKKSFKAVEIAKFDDDYDFSDKVLPVWKIEYNDKTVCVETSTARLRKISSAFEKFDDYSFAFFHKHEFMMWASKGAKDFSTMFWAGAQIVMVIFGLILYFKRKKKKR
ncbi:MAG TPA: hypothetical protein VGB84_00870 [Arachidicoccus sp.]